MSVVFNYDIKRQGSTLSDKTLDLYPALCDWMIFGWTPHPDFPIGQPGWEENAVACDIVVADGRGNDVMLGVPKAKAERIIELRRTFISELSDILREPDE